MSRDLWAEYKREREGVETLRDGDLGFAAYSIHGEECYIEDIHVVLEAREKGVARRLADQVETIARKRGCKYLTGTVHKGSSGVTVSVIAMLKVGFEVYSWDNEKILFIRRFK